MSRKRILCFTSYYLPGFKSGGPLRSLLHMQEWLGDEYEFAVVTRNRDLGETTPYAGLPTDRWQTIRGIQVWYLAPPYWRPAPLRAAIRDFQPDALYFHSSVDFSLTIMPLTLRWLGLLPAGLPVIVAPRGEFSEGARSIKASRKRIFFGLARAIGLYRGVTWHATKSEEREQILGLWGPHAKVVIAPNLPSRLVNAGEAKRRPKQPGSLRLVFLSRISRMKNLHGALEILRETTATVSFDIYGTTEDPEYWAQCLEQIGRLPENVIARFNGPVPPESVVSTLGQYDALFLPTLGENFGHVIHEALLAGCPVVISDQTPWRGLEAAQAGFDLPLHPPESFITTIERLAKMDEPEFFQWSAGARSHGFRYSSDPALAESTRLLIASALA